MENKINLVELLRNCPSGMELDCTLYENVVFDYIDSSPESVYPIRCLTKTLGGYNTLAFTHNGCNNGHPNAKCVIFPKGKTTWEGFHRPFKDGDIITCNNRVCTFISIFKDKPFEKSFRKHCSVILGDNKFVVATKYADYTNPRFATEEEKEILFKAIKDNGYKWNDKIKTLEKLVEPNFTVGDTIKNKNNKWQAVRTIKSYVVGIGYFTTINDWVRIEDQDNWELVIRPMFKTGDRIRDTRNNSEGVIKRLIDKGYICRFGYGNVSISFKEQHYFKLVPNKFNINTLKPFDRVLFRMHDKDTWCNGFYSFYKNNTHFVNSFIIARQCIPYERNEHLIDTTNDCDPFFKTWEK